MSGNFFKIKNERLYFNRIKRKIKNWLIILNICSYIGW
jgi:hypothetical protein